MPREVSSASEPIVCPITQEEIKSPEIAVRTTCGHIFSKTALQEWINRRNTCPLCRSVIVDITDLENINAKSDSYIIKKAKIAASFFKDLVRPVISDTKSIIKSSYNDLISFIRYSIIQNSIIKPFIESSKFPNIFRSDHELTEIAFRYIENIDLKNASSIAKQIKSPSLRNNVYYHIAYKEILKLDNNCFNTIFKIDNLFIRILLHLIYPISIAYNATIGAIDLFTNSNRIIISEIYY